MSALPILGAFLEAAGTILEKRVLKKRSINYKNYTVFSFLAIVAIMLPFLYFIWDVDRAAFQIENVIRLISVVVFAVIANLLIFYSLKRENITEFEPAWIMQPLFTVLLAFILYSDERNWVTVVLALVASLTLVLAHVKKHHLKLDRYIIATVLGSLFFSVELVLSKPLLQYYSPLIFYFMRSALILLIVALVYHPKIKTPDKSSWIFIFIIALMWIIYRAIIYYGYENLGIVYTTVLFILSPVLMFIFAIVFLKEKPTIRQIVSTCVILLCVVIAFLLNN